MNEVQQYASPEMPDPDATPTAITAQAPGLPIIFVHLFVYGTLSYKIFLEHYL